MKKYLLLLAVSGLFLTSCEKCKDCEYKMEWQFVNDASTDDLYQSMGYANTQDYYDQFYSNVLPASEEFCGDELEAVEGYDQTIPGAYRIYIDCK